jgi:hypothetical protein
MLIKIGYNIALKFAFPTAMIHLLHVHPSRRSHLVEPERFETDPDLPVEEYYDRFGNHRGRIYAPAGSLRLFSEAVIRDSGELDAYAPDAVILASLPIPIRWTLTLGLRSSCRDDGIPLTLGITVVALAGY